MAIFHSYVSHYQRSGFLVIKLWQNGLQKNQKSVVDVVAEAWPFDLQGHRRPVFESRSEVLHLEFASQLKPGSLRWDLKGLKQRFQAIFIMVFHI